MIQTQLHQELPNETDNERSSDSCLYVSKKYNNGRSICKDPTHFMKDCPHAKRCEYCGKTNHPTSNNNQYTNNAEVYENDNNNNNSYDDNNLYDNTYDDSNLYENNQYDNTDNNNNMIIMYMITHMMTIIYM